MMPHLFFRYCAGVLLASFFGAASAALPEFTSEGVIQEIDKPANKIVVDNRTFYMTSSSRVFDVYTLGELAGLLRVGRTVGVVTDNPASLTSPVREIWILDELKNMTVEPSETPGW